MKNYWDCFNFMPELPEVETIRRDLAKKILDKKIKDIFVLDKRTLTPVRHRSDIRQMSNGARRFKKILIGKSFVGIERRGKLLIFKLNTNKFLLVHLKMTGQLIYEKKGNSKKQSEIIVGGHEDKNFKQVDKYARVVFEFEDSSKLYFNDLRIFGYLKIINEKELEKVKEGFGVEPLSPAMSPAKSMAMFKNKKTTIKAFLLNQKNIAGIGNIYTDEICFACGILPTRKVNTLNKKEIELILKNTKKILKLAIEKRGTTFNNYRDSNGNKGNFVSFLKVYGRQGQKCQKCGGEIKKIKVAGRGTHYCPVCQS